MRRKHYDLVVIGGGPGGSTAATLVAKQNHNVLLLERQTFPRHQIGESLLPATVHGICRLLGVREKVLNAGFFYKPGASFLWGRKPGLWGFKFRANESVPEHLSYSFQVERSKFDALLLENAALNGVEVKQAHRVEDVIAENGVVRGVRVADDDGRVSEVKASFVVDASGNTSRTRTAVGRRLYSKFFQNIAIYAYYLNGKRLPTPLEGNTLSAAFDQGWFWYIPLSDTLTSVGAVVGKEFGKNLVRHREQGLRDLIDRCPIISDLLSSATRETKGMYGQVRIRQDYSYSNTQFWRPGMCLVGDAACFIDPIFSSGVHLATYSALLAARSINSVLSEEFPEQVVFSEFTRRYRREFNNFYTFNLAFYDANRTEEEYYWNARSILGTDERNNDAFVKLVSGFAPEEFFWAREGLGKVLMAHVENPNADPTEAAGFDRSKFDVMRFAADMTSESYQIEGQAGIRPRRPELPMFSDGLVPSKDGLHWSRYCGDFEPKFVEPSGTFV